jgi:hypothetical protein
VRLVTSLLGAVSSHLSNSAKHWIDGGALLTALAAIFSVLPQATALLGFVWFALRIAIGVQEWKLNRRKLRKD